MKNNGLGDIAARRIKAARLAEGLTQAEIGDYLGLGRDAVSKIENGYALLSLRHLEKLAKILNRPITYFLDIDIGLSSEEERVLAIYRALPLDGPYRLIAHRALASLLQSIEEGQK